VVFGLLFAGGMPAAAQEIASSFEQLAVLVKPNDTISVVDATGAEIKGRIGKLSRDLLTLATSEGTRHLGEADVAAISQRRGDSLRNGAIIGAVAGLAYYAAMVAIFWDTDGGDVFVPSLFAGGALFAGMGAAAGVGIDALISSRRVIYRKAVGQSGIQVAPIVGHGRRGAAVTVRF
jgi:hypothetical protein